MIGGMRYRILAFLLASGLSVVSSTFAHADRASAVLAQARKALGGDEALAAVKRLQADGEFRRTIGEMAMEGELEILLEPPDRLRRNEELTLPMGTMVRTEVLNGDDVWDDTNQRSMAHGGHGMAIMTRGPGGDLDPARMKEMQLRMRRADLARFLLAWLLTSDATIAHAGIAEAPDGKADVLTVTPADGAAMRLFIDQQTHLPLMLSWQGPQPRVIRRAPGAAPGGEAVSEQAAPPQAAFEMRLSEYRKVDGIHLPHLIQRSMNGQPNEEWTIESYKVNPVFKSSTFTK